MRRLTNITLGVDWEILVNDVRTGCSAGKEKLSWLIEQAQVKMPHLEVGEDFDLFEVRLGVTKSYDESVDKIIYACETSQKIAHRRRMVLVPVGMREHDLNPAGGHIHAGSVERYEDVVELHNRLMPFVPVIIAFASSSPSVDGKFMSLRLRTNARQCSRPMSLMEKDGSPQWGTDVCIRYPEKSTLEFRAADSQPTPTLMAEFAALFLGLTSQLSRVKKAPLKPDPIEYGINRLNAMINGARAKFIVEGEYISAGEMMSDIVIPLALLGLSLIHI